MSRLPLKRAWLAAIGLAMQLVGVLALPVSGPAEQVRVGLLIGSALPLLIWVWLNRRWWGVGTIGIGLLLNLAAMLANGGLMPVNPDAVARAGLTEQLRQTVPGQPLMHTKDVLQTPAQTNLAWLRDSVVVRPSRAPGHVLSPGDLVIYAGLLLTLTEIILWLRGREQVRQGELRPAEQS